MAPLPGPEPSVVHGDPVVLPGPGVLARYTYWARTTPDAIAVEDGPFSWTYSELDAFADRLAEALRGRVRRGDLVGVCLDRSAALVATAIAVARLGAVYLPLGPRPGERRLAAVAEQLHVTCLIANPGVLPPGDPARPRTHMRLPLPIFGANVESHVVAAFAPTWTVGQAADRHSPAVPDGTFYAVLTSGSTGTPKAVAVGGASLDALIAWYNTRTGLGPGDRHSLLVGVSFDPHVKELWAALCAGAALTVAPDEVRWDPACLTAWWLQARVTVAVLPTPLAELVLARPWPRLPLLRYLEIGGDRLRQWPGHDVTAAVHNSYGPAEATVVTTSHALRAANQDTTAPPPIGLPVAGAVLLVTDDDGQPVPRGAAGELRIGGDCLALGYLDPELTARRFVAAPPGLPGVNRVYRTGDRVRMRPNGVLDFLGRIDDQVKISGVRVEPAEVEAALEHHPRVRRAVVLPQAVPGGPLRLHAYVLAEPGGPEPDGAELLVEAQRWLLEQAVPATVRRVDAFPLDANGKIDRAALSATRHAVSAAESPSTETERHLLGLCRELLADETIGIRDGFAEAGATSLVAARLLARLEERHGVRLRAPELLRQKDLHGVAQLLDTRRAAAAAAAATEVRP